MTEQEFYEVVVYSPVGIRTVTPHGIGNIRETYSRKEKTRFQMLPELEGDVVFRCEDYTYFNELANSERRYDDCRAVISIKCSGAWVVKWRTMIDVMKGEFDHERKTFTCSFVLEDFNREFDSKKSTEHNLLSIVSRRVATTPQYAAGLIYQNGVPLYWALLAMMRETLAVTSITSDFFQWNSTNPSYVVGHSDKLQNQALFHKSDIVKASSPGYSAATVLNMSLERLIENLCNLYNLQWTLDAAGNFRIEHLSWFTYGSSFDLTVPKYDKSLIGTNVFNYDDPVIFRQEKFIGEENINLDFVGTPIEYKTEFVRNIRKRSGDYRTAQTEDTLERTVDLIVDIDAIYGNINSAISSEPNRDQPLDGVVLLALTSTNGIQQIPAILGIGLTLVQHKNNVNAWAQLHEAFWTDGRLFPEGYVNFVLTPFTNVQRIKKRKRIIIPFCCDETMDANGEFITAEGTAIAQKVAIDYRKGTAELELIYEDNPTGVLNAPNAVDDIYATDISTQLDTLGSAKPSVLANDTGATNALEETKATILGGNVVIDSAGHFVYDPPAGVTGSDLFSYVALNGAGRADTANVKIILKVAGVYVHLDNEDYSYALFPPGSGSIFAYVRIIRFYEDPLLQVPLDLTNYGININYTVNNNGVVTVHSTLASGYELAAVSNAYPAARTITVSITPDPAYTII